MPKKKFKYEIDDGLRRTVAARTLILAAEDLLDRATEKFNTNVQININPITLNKIKHKINQAKQLCCNVRYDVQELYDENVETIKHENRIN